MNDLHVECQDPTASDWLETARLKLNGRGAGENSVKPRSVQTQPHIVGSQPRE
jgi:hypothetical protein